MKTNYFLICTTILAMLCTIIHSDKNQVLLLLGPFSLFFSFLSYNIMVIALLSDR